jgi:hypothetical protein
MHAHDVARINATDLTIFDYPIPQWPGFAAPNGFRALTIGPDGTLWVGDALNAAVDKLVPNATQ